MNDSDDTLAMLRDSLARYLADHYEFDKRRALLANARAEAPLWRSLARDLGLLGATFPEAQGGLGGTTRDGLALMETFGEALAGEPWLSTVVVAGDLLVRAGGERARALVERIVAGDALVAFAHDEPHQPADASDLRCTLRADGDAFVLEGRKSVVQCAPWATQLLVGACDGTGGASLALVDADAPGIVRRDYRTVDGGWASEVRFDAVRVPADALLGAPGAAAPLIERALDLGALAVSFESLGVMRRLMADTIAYANQRRQFGVAIASFQALQHRVADMHIALAQAQALVRAAAAGIDADPAQRAAAVSSAKVMAGRACRTVGQGAIQVHGGMGMTDELAVGHYFKRATAIELSWGTTDRHLRRVDRLTA